MVELNLPQHPLRIKNQNDRKLIFDQIRKKYVQLTPEEWVRQNFLNYLIRDLAYPRTLIKVESGLSVNDLEKRTDILVYNQHINPHLLVECKAAHIALSHKALEQLAIYNRTVKAQYLVLTNGMKHYCCYMNYGLNTYQFQSNLPAFRGNSQIPKHK